MKPVVRILWWALWAVAALATTAMTMAFAFFRPTTFIGDRLVDARSQNIAALLAMFLMVLALGIGARRLVRKPVR